MARTEVKLAPRSAQRPVRAAAPRRQWPAFIEGTVTYLREVLIELKRVEWPSRREATSATIVVVVVLVLMAVYLGTFDYFYTILVKRFLIRPGA
jgi:preprotein translocase subunit SecE